MLSANVDPTARAPDLEEHRFGRPPEGLPSIEPAPPTRLIDTGAVRLEVIDLARARDRARFIDMAPPLYAGDPNYVAPLRMERMKFLDPARNPAFENLDVRPVLATLDGRVVGRITAHIDRAYNTYHQSRSGWFGFFECINDRRVAHALLADATRWLASQGMNEVFGPSNFTTNHQCGLLVENWDRPAYVEMTYNPRYYEELLTSFGLGKAKDLFVWWIDIRAGLENPRVARVAKVVDRIRKREGITLRTIDMKDYHAEVERLFALYNEAWEKNWGFVPLGRKEFESVVHELKQIVAPEIVLFVEVDGKPVGFACSLPNINDVLPRDGRLFPLGWWKLLTGRKKIKHGRVFTLGVLPAYRKRGLESLMCVETVLRARELGLESGELGWTLEDNTLINRSIEQLDGKMDRRYRILGMTL